MATVVTSQTLENGPRRVVMKFTNYGDTAESAVKKVDASSSGPLGVSVQGQTFYPGINLKVADIWYNVANVLLQIQWEATSNVDMLLLQGFGHWKMLDTRAGFQGITCPVVTGATGSILFTTIDPAAGATGAPPGSYTVIMEMIKGVPQS